MDPNKKMTIEEILSKAKELKGKTFDDLGIEKTNNKGLTGQVIEKFFGLEVNSRQEADFRIVGVDLELKVTPIKKLKKSGLISAKERLSLTMINYNKEYAEDFENSELYKKIKNTLIIYYFDNGDGDRIFDESYLMAYTEDEKEVIKTDYKNIIKKISEGKIGEISEGDTTLLGAARKGSGGSEKKVKQISTGAEAYKRAWTFKTGFMTRQARKHYGMPVSALISLKDIFYKNIKDIMKKYINHSVDEMFVEIGKTIQSSKSRHANVIKGIMKKNNLEIDKIHEYSMVAKSVILNSNGSIQESLSFKNLLLDDICNTEFKDTDVYNAMTSGIILFIFTKQWRFKETRIIKFSNKKIKIAKKTYDRIKNEINSSHPFLPKKSDDLVIHMRPKDANGRNKITLANGEQITKPCLWINKNELNNI